MTKNPTSILSEPYILILDRDSSHSGEAMEYEWSDFQIAERSVIYIGECGDTLQQRIRNYIYETLWEWNDRGREINTSNVNGWMDEIYVYIGRLMDRLGGYLPDAANEVISEVNFICEEYRNECGTTTIRQLFHSALQAFTVERAERNARRLAEAAESETAKQLLEAAAKEGRRKLYAELRAEFESENTLTPPES